MGTWKSGLLAIITPSDGLTAKLNSLVTFFLDYMALIRIDFMCAYLEHLK